VNIPEQIFWFVFAAVAIYFVFNIFRRGGLRGALFNAQISETLGEVEATGPKLITQHLKVHVLERGDERLVGIEVKSTSVASYQMLPVVLKPDQARELAALLQKASGQL
jgi:hypothetical protein